MYCDLVGITIINRGIEMGISLISIPLLAALASPVYPQSQAVMPTMSSVEPDSGKIGDLLVVQGANLDRDNVAALYLTDGKTDFKVTIIEQTNTSIKFKIPAEVRPGRLALMVLTRGKEPKLIEEPVKITVEPEITTATISSSASQAIEIW